jgi:hypothetical protein
MSDTNTKFNQLFKDYVRNNKSNFNYEVIKVNVAKPLFQQTSEDEEYKKNAK